jgi:hypothetical protein
LLKVLEDSDPDVCGMRSGHSEKLVLKLPFQLYSKQMKGSDVIGRLWRTDGILSQHWRSKIGSLKLPFQLLLKVN